MESISRISSLLETGMAPFTIFIQICGLLCAPLPCAIGLFGHVIARCRCCHASLELRSLVPLRSSRPYPRSRPRCQQCPPSPHKGTALGPAQEAPRQQIRARCARRTAQSRHCRNTPPWPRDSRIISPLDAVERLVTDYSPSRCPTASRLRRPSPSSPT